MPAIFGDLTNKEFYAIVGGVKTFISSVDRLTSQFDKATDTTLASITGLAVDLEAGIPYQFVAELFIDANGSGGSKFSMNGSVTATGIIYQINFINNSNGNIVVSSREVAIGGNDGQTGVTAGYCIITGAILVNAAGTFGPFFAQNASNGTSSVLVGSNFGINRVL